MHAGRIFTREEGEALRQQWFDAQGWQALPPQLRVWDAIGRGLNGLLESPTGAGKSYAAFFGFLPLLGSGPRGLRLLYISPLKALTRDMEQAFRKPCEDLDLNFAVESRTGDTTAARRRKMKTVLPEILLTTPESLALMLADANAPLLFGNLQGIIIDEWHELLSSKRGSLLELSLSRVRDLSPKALTWALSATLPNHEEAAQAACGVESKIEIVSGFPARPIQIETLLPTAADRLAGVGSIGLRMLPLLADWLNPEYSTLIFTNTRSQAERWYESLLMLRPEWETILALHHGSLDPREREAAEIGVKNGALRFVICTSSLDLGVDFPEVDRVVQIGPPKSISRLTQRAGRSAHAPGLKSRLLFVPTHNLELIEITACQRALEAGFMEARRPRQEPLDVLIQHMVSCAIAGGFHAEALFAEIRSAYAFRNLQRETFDWILRFIVEGGTALSAYPQYCRVKLEEGLFIVRDRRIMQLHKQNIGTILSESSMQVKLGRRTLGSIEESFMVRLRKGDRFLYGGRWLEIVSMADLVVYTRLSRRNESGVVPTWFGQKLPWSPHLAPFMRQVMEDQSTAVPALSALRSSQEKISIWPRAAEYLAEISLSREGQHFFLFAFEGQALHESLASLLIYRISRLLAASFAVAANDYGFEIVASTPVNWEQVLQDGLLSTDRLDDDLRNAVNHSELARRAFRSIARVSGLIHQNLPGRRHNGRQLQSSSGLLFDVLKRFDPGNLLVQEAEDEVLEEQFHRAGLEKLLLKLQGTPIKFQVTPNFSPLAFPLYMERVSNRLSTEQIAQRIERIKKSWKQSNGKSAAKPSPSYPRKRPTGQGAEL